MAKKINEILKSMLRKRQLQLLLRSRSVELYNIPMMNAIALPHFIFIDKFSLKLSFALDR